MPYIAKLRRADLNQRIDALAASIAHDGMEESAAFAMNYCGDLNYSITRLCMKVIQLRFGAVRYGTIAAVCGVLDNVKSEFYRRIAAPYEDKKIAKNGDVDLYEEQVKWIAEG
jgi:hypothetical protein